MVRFTRTAGFAILVAALALVIGCGSPNDPDVPSASNVYRIIGQTPTFGFPNAIALYNDTLFVAENSAGIGVYDLHNLNAPYNLEYVPTIQKATLVSVAADANALAVYGSGANALTYFYFLHPLELNSSSIFGDSGVHDFLTVIVRDSVESLFWTGPDPMGKHVSNTIRTVLADASDGVSVGSVFLDSTYNSFDSSRSYFFANEAILKLNYLGARPYGLASISGADTIAVGLTDLGVGIANVSREVKDQGGVWMGNADTPGEATKLVYQNGYIYVADGVGGLAVVDATDLSNPQYVASWKINGLDHVIDVAVYDHRLVVVDQYDGVYFLDVSQPQYPKYVGEYLVRQPTDAIFTPDGHLVVSSVTEGITVFDLVY